MKAKDIILKAMKRAEKERGLKIITPNNNLSNGHTEKADHNLIVMTDLSKLGHEDWVVITAYYAMYQSAMALLTKIGLESKDHATTAAIIEHFFREQINKDIIGKFNELKQRKDKIEALTINEKYTNYLWNAKSARETVQYGITITYKETDTLMNNARQFVNKIKIVLTELNDKIIETISKNINELKELSAKLNKIE